MRLSVLVGDTRPVDHQRNGQMLDADIVQDLVVSALQKGGIYKEKRFQPAGCHARAKRYGMFFGDTDIIELVGVCFGKRRRAGAKRHCSGDNTNGFVLSCKSDQFLVCNSAVTFSVRCGGFTSFQQKRRRSVKKFRFTLCTLITIAFLGQTMDQHRLVHILGEGKNTFHLALIIAVDGADIAKTERSKESLVHHKAFDHFLCMVDKAV